MEKAGIPDLERRLIINLHWRQHAAVRWDGEVSREVDVERGVRQGCVISPILFNLYSEFMIKEAMENVEGIKFNGINITDLRYADDAVLVADKRKKMQKMIDRLNKTCKAYGMEINVKKTKVMIMNGTAKPKGMKANAFKRWCYRMILGISWRDHVSTPKVMERVQIELQTELHFTRDMIKRKMEYAGHVLRGSSGLSHLQILEGRVEEKKKSGLSNKNMDERYM